MAMIRFERQFNVLEGNTLVLTVDGKELVYEVPRSNKGGLKKIGVTIREYRNDSRPEIGTPSLSVNPATDGMITR